MKQSYYDQGEKAINAITTEDGKTLVDPTNINTTFKGYYEDLSEYSDSSEKQQPASIPNLNRGG